MADPDDTATADPDDTATDPDEAGDADEPDEPDEQSEPRDTDEQGDIGSAERRSSRLDIAAGFVVLAYALWIVVQLAALLRSDDAYDRLQDLHAGTGARVLLSLVLLAVLWHTVQGALALLTDQLGPSWFGARTQRGVVWFVVLAAGIPGVLVVLWPAIAGIPT